VSFPFDVLFVGCLCSAAMAISLISIPIELVIEILSLALHEHPRPSDIFCVNRSFLALGQPILHSHLRFRTIRQLTLFAQQEENAHLACSPRTLTVKLPGGTATYDVFSHLAAALRLCRNSGGRAEGDHSAQVALDLLSLCLHSHARNPNLRNIYDALTLAK